MFFKYLQNVPRGTFLIKTTYKQLKVTFNKIKIPKNSICYTYKNRDVPRRTSINLIK